HVGCSAVRSAAGFVHCEDSVSDRRAVGRPSRRGGDTSGVVRVRSLFRSLGEQPSVITRGLAPFLPVFKTGRAGPPPAWKVRFLRRVVAGNGWVIAAVGSWRRTGADCASGPRRVLGATDPAGERLTVGWPASGGSGAGSSRAFRAGSDTFPGARGSRSS